MLTTYILLLEGDKIYVGITNNIDKRMQQHWDGYGSKWCKKYKPIKILKKININITNYIKNDKVLNYLNSNYADFIEMEHFIKNKNKNKNIKIEQKVIGGCNPPYPLGI
tara:strand:+ start:179 stop:505 length:327 start_codon:yes stop_codon:yes gene_type:complete